MNKIKTISSYLLAIINLSILIIPSFIVVTWYFIDTHTINMLSLGLLQNPFEIGYNINTTSIKWNILYKTIGATGHIISSLPTFLGLLILKSIFINYKNGEIFSVANAINYKRLSWLCFLNALIANPIGKGIMNMSTTLSNPPGERFLNIIFDFPSLEGLFFGAILIAMSLVMLEASKIQNEIKLTI